MRSQILLPGTLPSLFALRSFLTRVGADAKEQYETGHTVGGSRSATQVRSVSFFSLHPLSSPLGRLLVIQVLANVGVAVGLAALHWAVFGEEQARIPGGWAGVMIVAYLGNFASCCGDTWASELGILSASHPRLVTSCFRRRVPPGTNGGVTLWGTAASILGGAFMGLTFVLLSCLIAAPGEGVTVFFEQLALIPFAGALGGAGSLVDSFIGATMQLSLQDRDTKKVLTGRDVEEAISGRDPVPLEQRYIHISGAPILNNEQVNFVTNTAIGVLAGVLAWWW